MENEKKIVRTIISDGGWHNPLNSEHTARYFAEREILENGEWESLPNFPTDHRLPLLRNQAWFNELGELIGAGNNLKILKSEMAIHSPLISYRGSQVIN